MISFFYVNLHRLHAPKIMELSATLKIDTTSPDVQSIGAPIWKSRFGEESDQLAKQVAGARDLVASTPCSKPEPSHKKRQAGVARRRPSSRGQSCRRGRAVPPDHQVVAAGRPCRKWSCIVAPCSHESRSFPHAAAATRRSRAPRSRPPPERNPTAAGTARALPGSTRRRRLGRKEVVGSRGLLGLGRPRAAHERDPFFPSLVGLVNCSSFCFSLISLLFLRRCGGRARRDDRRSAFDGRPRNNELGDQGFAEGGVIRSRLFLISR
ncbi:uncharacterized protein LOC119299241 [Triticum dicoccoides]|uniref:uncharacterized protein LOC119299241 n=1 Tax=Triticum dicoccoides TaxID=85692 RepID=UPI001890414F|nr:uncharacterized protein LOC119299241 [Triticum dicoccoides]